MMFPRNLVISTLLVAASLRLNVVHAELTVGSPTTTPGSLNASGDNVDPAFSPDGLHLYFASNRAGVAGPADIFYADRASTADPWGPAVRLDAAINSNQAERGPFISATGLEFFFQRGSTVGVNSTLDIWVARRSSLTSSWGSPTPVAEVNSIYGDGWPVLSSSGLSLYFTSYPPGVSATVGRTYVATRPTIADPFGAPQPLFAGSLNLISADELTAIIDFESLTGVGGVDMWMVTRGSVHDSFGAPVNLGSPLNAKLDDFGARIAPDGKTVYFTSNRDGRYLIWEAPIIVPEPAAGASLLLGFGVLLRTCQRTSRQGRAGTGAPSLRAWPAPQR